MIKDIIVDHFEEIGVYFDNQIKIITCCPFEETPIFYSTSQNKELQYDLIIINCLDCGYWCQVIYQLSHELTHCFINCLNGDMKYHISWLEETICEAISLYFLNYFYNNWSMLPLYSKNTGYAPSIYDYLNNLLFNQGNNKLSLCTSMNELEELDKTSQDLREDRLTERIKLYNNITADNIAALINYRSFAIDNLHVDTVNYRQTYMDNSAVQYICDLQDSILGKDRKVN